MQDAALSQIIEEGVDVAHDLTPRRFGYWTGHFVVVASMVGAGILTSSGLMLKDAGNPVLLLTLWVVGGLLAIAGAITIAELATRLPAVGGDYLFVRVAFGPAAGFVVGWSSFILGFVAPISIIAMLSASYLVAPLEGWLNENAPLWISSNSIKIIASGMILAVTAVHIRTHKESSFFQIASTALKMGMLVLLVVAGLSSGQGEWVHFSHSSEGTKELLAICSVGIIRVSYAYSGWNGAGYLAGEIREPNRLLPRCLVEGTLSVMLLYVMVNVLYIYAIDPVNFTAMPVEDAQRIAEVVSKKLFGNGIGNVISILIGLSLVASVSAYVLTGPRIIFAMARDKMFPTFAGSLKRGSDLPVLATLVLGISSASLVWMGKFLELLDYASVGLAAVSAIVVASIFPIRRRTDLTGYRMPLYPLAPILYILLMGATVVFTLSQTDGESFWPAVLSLVTIVAGYPVGLLMMRLTAKSGSNG
jgi:APA family basic amino acid/polyamine antiporter